MHYPRALVAFSLSIASLAATAATAPGTLDHTFGAEGTRTVAASLDGGAARGPAKVVEGAEGRLYVVGHVDRDDATVAVAITRLTPDGDVDTGFGSEGLIEFTPDSIANAAAYGATVDAQQRLIVVGEAESFGRRPMICRFMPDGTPDDTFGGALTPGCRLLHSVGFPAWASDVLVQTCEIPDECVDGTRLIVAGTVVGGDLVRRAMVAALRADGSDLDTSFGDEGVRMVEHPKLMGVSAEATALAQDVSGELVVSGVIDISATDSEMFVMRLRETGAVLTSFGSDGLQSVGFDLFNGGGRTVATAVHLSDEGWPMLAGYTQADENRYELALVRLTNDGDFDLTFDGSADGFPGALLYSPCDGVCDIRGNDMALTPDGQILVTGNVAVGDTETADFSALNNTYVMRFHADGTPDATFRSADSGHDGLSVIDHGAVQQNSDDVGSTLLLQGDRIVVAGYARALDPDMDDDRNDYYDFALARLSGGNPIFSDGFE